MTPRMKKRIAIIPNDSEWHKTSSQETFEDNAEKMLDWGLSEDEIMEVLESLYFAVANEYGD